MMAHPLFTGGIVHVSLMRGRVVVPCVGDLPRCLAQSNLDYDSAALNNYNEQAW